MKMIIFGYEMYIFSISLLFLAFFSRHILGENIACHADKQGKEKKFGQGKHQRPINVSDLTLWLVFVDLC